MLVRGLLEENWSPLWTAEPGGAAHLHPGAFHQSIGLTEVENQLHAASRKDAFASMRARTVVRPQVIDQPLQLTWAPDAVGPTAERRDTAHRLERDRSEATRRIHAGHDRITDKARGSGRYDHRIKNLSRNPGVGAICSVTSTRCRHGNRRDDSQARAVRSEEHTSELQSLRHLVCRL